MPVTFILNPNAGKGNAVALFDTLRPDLQRDFPDYASHITAGPREVAAHVATAQALGHDAVIAVGGDGTTQSVLEALMTLPAPRPALGLLPLGTGRDFARTLQLPLAPDAALRWLATAAPRPIDVGSLQIDGVQRYFLNVASVGLSGAVAQRVNGAPRKRPWTFMAAIIQTLLRFVAPRMRVFADDLLFYEGASFILSVANGRYFARGLPINPLGKIDDGRFDLILVESMSKPAVFAALPTLLRGTHLRRSDVHHRTARRVRVEASTPPIGMDMDGEGSVAACLDFELLPRAIPLLTHDLPFPSGA